jgi:hypothetical protein
MTAAHQISDDGAMMYAPPLLMRIKLWLGFRYSALAHPPLDDDAAYYVHHRVTVFVDWRDRLRLLWSGCVQVDILGETDTAAVVLKTHTNFAVLPREQKRAMQRAHAAVKALADVPMKDRATWPD